MLLLLLNYVVLRALWKIDVDLISTLVNKSIYHYYYYSKESEKCFTSAIQQMTVLCLFCFCIM